MLSPLRGYLENVMMRPIIQILVLPIFATVFVCTGVMADSVELTGSGQVTGEVSRRGDLVIVSVDDKIQVAFPKTRVSRVVESKELTKYKSLAKQVGEDAGAHYQLARWCKAAGNVPGLSQYYTRFHMQRAVELNPNHAEARASLGYTKDDGGKWILRTDLMRSRGMILKGGRWVIPEAASLEENADESNKEAKLWIREIVKLVKIVMRGNGADNRKYDEAIAELNSINDPLAATAIAQQFRNSRGMGGRGSESQPPALRRLWITLLGRFRTSTSVRALVEAGIDEPNPDLREMALDQLLQYGSGTAIANYKRSMLSSKSSNDLINRAARALSAFPADRELAMQYISSLVTTHTQEIAPSGNMNATFGGAGGGMGGMSSGSKPKKNSQKRSNPSVLTLVKKTVPEVDFGYDEVKWRNYLANQKLSFSGDLRRDR